MALVEARRCLRTYPHHSHPWDEEGHAYRCPGIPITSPVGDLDKLREAFNEAVELLDGEAVDAAIVLARAVAAFLGEVSP